MRERRDMAVGVQLFWCLLFAFALICSARNTMFLSGEELAVMTGRSRSLKVNLNDYGEASANHGHDPRNKIGVGNGRRGHDIP